MFVHKDGRYDASKKKKRLKNKSKDKEDPSLKKGKYGSKHKHSKFEVEDVQLRQGQGTDGMDRCEWTFRSITAGKGDDRNIDEVNFEEFRHWLLRLPPEERPLGLKKVNPWKSKSIRDTFTGNELRYA